MKIYLVTPKNPSNFWTYDPILPVLGKDCIFPNLSMPTVAGIPDLEMPAGEDKLTADEIAALEEWVADGAVWEAWDLE